MTSPDRQNPFGDPESSFEALKRLAAQQELTGRAYQQQQADQAEIQRRLVQDPSDYLRQLGYQQQTPPSPPLADYVRQLTGQYVRQLTGQESAFLPQIGPSVPQPFISSPVGQLPSVPPPFPQQRDWIDGADVVTGAEEDGPLDREQLQAAYERARPEPGRSVAEADLRLLVCAVPRLLGELRALEELLLDVLTLEPCHQSEHAASHRESAAPCPRQAQAAMGLLLDGFGLPPHALPRVVHRRSDGELERCCEQDGNLGTWLVHGRTVSPDLVFSGDLRRR